MIYGLIQRGAKSFFAFIQVENSFKYAFPDARNAEWQMDGVNYKVKFETGEGPGHHKVWYKKSGENSEG